MERRGVAEITFTVLLLGVVALLSLLAFGWGLVNILKARDAVRVYDAERSILGIDDYAAIALNEEANSTKVVEVHTEGALVRFLPEPLENVSIYLVFETPGDLVAYNLTEGEPRDITEAVPGPPEEIAETLPGGGGGYGCLLLMWYETPFVEVLVPSRADLIAVNAMQFLRGAYGDGWDKYLVSEGAALLPGGLGFNASESTSRGSSLVVFSRPSEALYRFTFFTRARLMGFSQATDGSVVVNITLFGCRARSVGARSIAVPPNGLNVALRNGGYSRLAYKLSSSELFNAYIYIVTGGGEVFRVSDVRANIVEIEVMMAEIHFRAW